MTRNLLLSFLVLAFVLGAALSVANPAVAGCSFRPVPVNVRQTELPLRLDRSLSSRTLTATSSTPVSAGNIVLGHGGGGMQISGNFEFTVSGNAEDGYCPKISKVNIELQVAPSIKMANTLRQGTCEYNAVYQHEMFHVGVLQRTAQSAAQQIPSIVNTRLQSAISRLRVSGTDKNVIHNQLQAEFSRILASVNDQMGAFMNNEQSKIDNPAEYARVQNSCAFNRRY